MTEESSGNFDVIIIGSGVGGAVAAFNLAQKGRSVLVLERGTGILPQGSNLPLWSEAILDASVNRRSFPFLGEGLGGSSRLFGMVMERLEDFEFASHGGAWPESLGAWTPFFARVEEIFGVTDARPIAELTPFLEQINRRGLDTYPLRLASRQIEGCRYCQSCICEKQGCKIDAVAGPLQLALKTGRVVVRTQHEVLKLNQHNGHVRSVSVKHEGTISEFRGRHFVLAAGALRTPVLLRRSANLASGNSFQNLPHLGRNLMRHLVDLFVVTWPEWRRLNFEQKVAVQSAKAWGSRTYYQTTGDRLGTIQAFGRMPDFRYVWQDLQAQSPLFKRTPFLRPVVELGCNFIFRSPIVATIVDDEPQFENRIEESGQGDIVIHYRTSAKDWAKVEKMRANVKRVFGPMLRMMIAASHQNTRLAHACGTCRMGDDSKSGVVDHFGKVHQSENLWVADASVFPSGTGKNPALAIAAHALRMTEQISI